MVEIRNLSHRFDDGALGLNNVNLALGAGEFVVLAGENGAGKSLLMRHLVGLVAPTSGSILYRGREIGPQLKQVRQAIGLVFQDSGAQIVSLTVEEDVGFGPRNRGWSPAEVDLAITSSLEAVGLLGHRKQPCSQLSGGELRRAAIAGVLALRPEIVVLDEPFTGLDFPSVQAVLGTLVRLHQTGITIILLTHELDKCLALATRLVLMSSGTVIADGAPTDLWELITTTNVHRPPGGPEKLAEMTWLA
jgi:biotin transport system ATP-binding protein